MKAFIYNVFGLRVLLPHAHKLLPISSNDGAADVVVRYETVPAGLTNILVEKYNALMEANVAVGHDGAVLWTTEYARFLVNDGCAVHIETTKVGVKPGAILRFILSNCLPAALIQRGCLAMHANAIATPRGAVVIAGQSGAGKSTLLGALVSRGFPMLSDDVTAICLNDSRAEVAAGFPQYRLCEDALDKLAPRDSIVRALGGPRGKYSVAAPSVAFESRAVPLQAIYILEAVDSDDVRVTMLNGPAKLAALRLASYAPTCLTHLPKQIAALAAIASVAPVYSVRRPQSRWTIDELIELVTEQATGHANQNVA